MLGVVVGVKSLMLLLFGAGLWIGGAHRPGLGSKQMRHGTCATMEATGSLCQLYRIQLNKLIFFEIVLLFIIMLHESTKNLRCHPE